MKKRKKKVVQRHHISYDPEVVVTLYKGEHWGLTQLQRRKNISEGFIKALKVFIALNEHNAKDIDWYYDNADCIGDMEELEEHIINTIKNGKTEKKTSLENKKTKVTKSKKA